MIVCTGYDVMIWNGGLDVMWITCDAKDWRTVCDVD
jgi:hypothetical protein